MKYKVLSNLNHGDRTYVAGEEVEMDEEMAKSLVEDSVLGIIPKEVKEPPVEKEPKPKAVPLKKGRKASKRK